MTPQIWWLGRAALALGCIALLSVVCSSFVPSDGTGRLKVISYLGYLDRRLRFVRSNTSARGVLFAQLGVGAFCILAATWLHSWPWLLWVPVAALLPWSSLERRAARRITQVEDQVEPWLNAVANALKASPSLADAIASTTTLVPAPISEEIDVLVKEYELGTPLDRALDNLSDRIASQTLAGTVLALKVARKSGGNLPEMLENAATALRELARLEGVVRTKTAEGKAQAFVIGLIPAPMVAGIHAMDPHFFEPLASTLLGKVIVVAAAGMWAAAILLARKILAVDV